MAEDEPRVMTIQIDGKDHEVPVPDGYFTQEEVDQGYVPAPRYANELRRLKKKLDGMTTREALLADDGFLETLIEERGDVLRQRLNVKMGGEGGGGGGGEGSDLAERIRKQVVDTITERELKPRDKTIKDLTDQLESTRNSGRDQEARQAALETGVKEGLVGMTANDLRQRMRYDSEHGRWFVVGEDGEFLVSSRTGAGALPYMTALEYLEGKREKGGDEAKELFKDLGRPGAGYKGPGGPKGGKLDINAQIQEAEAKGDWALAGRLKVEKAREVGVRTGQATR